MFGGFAAIMKGWSTFKTYEKVDRTIARIKNGAR